MKTATLAFITFTIFAGSTALATPIAYTGPAIEKDAFVVVAEGGKRGQDTGGKGGQDTGGKGGQNA